MKRRLLRICALIMIIIFTAVSASSEQLEESMYLFSAFDTEASVTVALNSSDLIALGHITYENLLEQLGEPFLSRYEENGFWGSNVWIYSYVLDVEGTRTAVEFVFNADDTLEMMRFFPFPLDGEPTGENYDKASIERFYTYYSMFERELGEPQVQAEKRWLDETYRNSPDMWDIAFENGDYIYPSVAWVNENFSVNFVLFASEEQVTAYIYLIIPAENV